MLFNFFHLFLEDFSFLASIFSERNLRLPALRSGRTARSLTLPTFFRSPYIFIHSRAFRSSRQPLCARARRISSPFLRTAPSIPFSCGRIGNSLFLRPKFLELPIVSSRPLPKRLLHFLRLTSRQTPARRNCDTNWCAAHQKNCFKIRKVMKRFHFSSSSANGPPR